MQYVWKHTVRQGLRSQAVTDLHDFLDVHRNIGPYTERLCARIISGRYRPGTIEVVTLEKKDGIARRLLLPSPADALILQTLVEAFQPALLAHQPTTNSYYSRTHSGRSVEHIDQTFPYPWWLLWPEFQKRIWEFARAYPHVVVTDVANYFDCIPLTSLRNLISSMGEFQESLLDFLFFMLETFTWRPFYMPMSGVGVPQIDFDAPRLLAHAYLFAADRELQSATEGDFVRWMDDINFGSRSIPEARQTLGRLETVLNSYGLRLNPGKTRIMSSEEAAAHFWVQENMQLNIVTNLINSGALNHSTGVPLREYLHGRYEAFAERPQVGNSQKIVKRFFTIFGRLQDDTMEVTIPSVLAEQPVLREAALGYSAKLGFSDNRFNQIADYLRSGNCVDDASLFQSAVTIVDWHIPAPSPKRALVVNLARDIIDTCESRNTGVICGLRLLAKYGTSIELESFLQDTQEIWSKSDWASRQVAAVAPRLSHTAVVAVGNVFASNGLLDALGVLSHLEHLAGLLSLDRQLRAYLSWPPSQGFAYPLPKVLIALALMKGRLAASEQRQLSGFMRRLVADEVYLELLVDSEAEGELTLGAVVIQPIESDTSEPRPA